MMNEVDFAGYKHQSLQDQKRELNDRINFLEKLMGARLGCTKDNNSPCTDRAGKALKGYLTKPDCSSSHELAKQVKQHNIGTVEMHVGMMLSRLKFLCCEYFKRIIADSS